MNFTYLQDLQDDVDDGENSENECSSGAWDSERLRSDGAKYDDSVPDVKPLNAMSHSLVNSNRVQPVSIARKKV